MKDKIRFFTDEEGVETIEYALIAALIAIAAVVAATFLGGEVSSVYQNVGEIVCNSH